MSLRAGASSAAVRTCRARNRWNSLPCRTKYDQASLDLVSRVALRCAGRVPRVHVVRFRSNGAVACCPAGARSSYFCGKEQRGRAAAQTRHVHRQPKFAQRPRMHLRRKPRDGAGAMMYPSGTMHTNTAAESGNGASGGANSFFCVFPESFAKGFSARSPREIHGLTYIGSNTQPCTSRIS